MESSTLIRGVEKPVIDQVAESQVAARGDAVMFHIRSESFSLKRRESRCQSVRGRSERGNASGHREFHRDPAERRQRLSGCSRFAFSGQSLRASGSRGGSCLQKKTASPHLHLSSDDNGHHMGWVNRL